MGHRIIKAAGGFVGLVIIPYAIELGVTLAIKAVTGAYKIIKKVRHENKIKKGLIDGSVIEIDGAYYEVIIYDREEG